MPRLSPAIIAQLVLFIFCGFWLNSWNIALFDLDEGAFTEATREMLASGDFLMTYLDGEPRYDKPILSYWLQALSVSVFGPSEFSSRLPSMLCASAWAVLVFYWVLQQSQDPHSALFAAGALALSPVPGLIGHAATADAALNLFISLSFYCLWQYLNYGKKPSLSYFYLWIALGALTKGPIAVALPFASLVLFLLAYRRISELKQIVFYPKGWLLFMAITLPWVITLSLKDHGDFLRHFLLDHNLTRYTRTRESHGGHWWYYLVVLPVAILPFSLVIPAILKKISLTRASPLHGYLFIWFGLVFFIFSASGTQLPHYILYGMPPFFILMGLHRAELLNKWLFLIPSVFFIVLVLALPTILQHITTPAHREYEQALVALLKTTLPAHLYVCGFGALVIVVLALVNQHITASAAALRGGIVVAVLSWTVVAPWLAQAQQDPVKAAAIMAKANQAPVVRYHFTMPSFSTYRGAVTPKRLPLPGEWVFTRIDKRQQLQAETGRNHTVRFQSGGVLLLEQH